MNISFIFSLDLFMSKTYINILSLGLLVHIIIHFLGGGE